MVRDHSDSGVGVACRTCVYVLLYVIDLFNLYPLTVSV